MLSLNVFGRFRITDPDDIDRGPRSAKARGLLVLLATAPHYSRSRVWLQDKLWSDRDAKRGSDSLRQTLVEIRKAFGPYQEILQADREKVAFDPSRFKVSYRLVEPPQDWNDEHDAFADIDIPDPEFEDWIRDIRSSLAEKARVSAFDPPRPSVPPKPAIFFQFHSDHQLPSELINSRILALTTASLHDLDDFEIFSHIPHASSGIMRQPVTGLSVSVRTATMGRRSHITFTISHAETGRLYASRTENLGSSSEEALHHLCGTLVQTVLITLRERKGDLAISNCAALLASNARNLIFRFDRQSLAEADRHLNYAYERDPRPQYVAWRAFLRNMAQFQHRSTAFLGDEITSTELVQEALRQDGNSPGILSIGAHLEYLGGGSSRGSLKLAERAAQLDPLNPINMAILSNAELVLDKLSASRRSATIALKLTGGGEHRAFVEFFCCMSAAAVGDYNAAIGHAEAALILRPAFRAPLRYLIALYIQEGMTMRAERAIDQLRLLEPDFTPARFLDDDYPVTTMRRIRLIDTISA
ncbi:hypothetical protein [Agrobacterium larrymoorei]|uniref:Tetratricopeptide (TPR) repeat protein n=1 Tax=Agrobacterium larrymoorei TaxID=160699 RepID=A0ABU0ULT7_9HYPH|nr:hypothetical protein [Agrobacterium larrymoorei]MDQ1185923.1 tetratricopeptide (TPR) repeat protein [Agrobacterium larrymoorei]